MDVKSLSSLSETCALLSLCSHILSRSSDSVLALLLVSLLAVVVERLRGGGVLQALGSPRDPGSTGSSAGSNSVERCEGMVAVAEDPEADEVEAETVVVVAEVEEAELALAAVADVLEAGLS